MDNIVETIVLNGRGGEFAPSPARGILVAVEMAQLAVEGIEVNWG